ncbi:similar to Saccharomyces cerevisiae YGL237C HAP2 Subunit of the heme-activated [Maudiozyma saulgeensis]|uniref:Transcriptional activator HAP2 n=1 Tax=Maudiozyma saulgeensis TaxID=1789683 RepID=A0A1X7QYH3_9SACH|nr:similar to Saccharomyces cerevisiae YGL237C HAP2 Subunit of the heme-activated [Kazachstania saulgeensis]
MNANEDNYRPLEADLVQTNTGISNDLSTDTQSNNGNIINQTNPHTSASDLYLYHRLNREAAEKSASNMYMNDLPQLNSKSSKLENNDINSNINVNTETTMNDISQAHIETQLINKLDPSDPSDLVMDDRNVTQHDITSEYNNGANIERETTPDQPFYVNAKQYYRILKRRYARARLEENLRISRERKPYLHESRHKHAMRRPRGQGGRFLTAAEIEELKSKGRIDKNGDVIPEDKENDNSDDGKSTEIETKRDIAKIVHKNDNNGNNKTDKSSDQNISITSEIMPIQDKA